MSLRDLRLALIDADELCAREVARRVRGDLFCVRSDQSGADNWLPNCDAVALLGTSADLDFVARCAHAGKHVLVASDACGSQEVLPALSSIPRSPGKLFVHGNSLQFLPSRQLILEQLASGKLGEPGMIRVHRWDSGAEASRLCPGLPHYAANEISMVVRCFGLPLQTVFATRMLESSGCCVHLGFASGGMALLDFVTAMPVGDSYSSFSIIGSRGAAYADDHPNVQLLYRGGEPRGLRARETPSADALMVCAFASSVARCESESSSGAQQFDAQDWSAWSSSMAVMVAVRECLELGQAVTPSNPR